MPAKSQAQQKAAGAALAASLFHFGAVRVREVKAHLAARGVAVRL